MRYSLCIVWHKIQTNPLKVHAIFNFRFLLTPCLAMPCHTMNHAARMHLNENRHILWNKCIHCTVKMMCDGEFFFYQIRSNHKNPFIILLIFAAVVVVQFLIAVVANVQIQFQVLHLVHKILQIWIKISKLGMDTICTRHLLKLESMCESSSACGFRIH